MKSTKENLHPFLDAAGSTVTEENKMAVVLNIFFTSVFNNQTLSNNIYKIKLKNKK